MFQTQGLMPHILRCDYDAVSHYLSNLELETSTDLNLDNITNCLNPTVILKNIIQKSVFDSEEVIYKMQQNTWKINFI